MGRQALVRGIVIALFFWSGCNFLDALGEEGLSFATGDDRYDSGDQVTLSLENHKDQEVGYNLCTSSLQRQAGDTWERPEAADSDIDNDGTRDACTLELIHLEPDEETSYEKRLPIDLEEGTYRYQDSVVLLGEDPERDVTITTNTFTVD